MAIPDLGADANVLLTRSPLNLESNSSSVQALQSSW